MYARQINGAEFTFGVSGKLLRNALVMYDVQTESLWAHFTGKAVQGPMLGTALGFIPALQTDWATWKELYPETLVLDKGGGYLFDSYDDYYGSRRAGLHGESSLDQRLEPKEVVMGLLLGSEAKAYAFGDLAQHRVVNDQLGAFSVLVVYDPASRTGMVYSRQVGDLTLTFQAVEDSAPQQATGAMLHDRETGTLWWAFTGEALSGPLAGKQLGRLPSNYAFWFAWHDYHPETLLYGPP